MNKVMGCVLIGIVAGMFWPAAMVFGYSYESRKYVYSNEEGSTVVYSVTQTGTVEMENDDSGQVDEYSEPETDLSGSVPSESYTEPDVDREYVTESVPSVDVSTYYYDYPSVYVGFGFPRYYYYPRPWGWGYWPHHGHWYHSGVFPAYRHFGRHDYPYRVGHWDGGRVYRSGYHHSPVIAHRSVHGSRGYVGSRSIGSTPRFHSGGSARGHGAGHFGGGARVGGMRHR